MSINPATLQEMARIGSPTAAKLIEALERETRQAKAQREAERQAAADVEHAQRVEALRVAREEVALQLQRYESARTEIHAALLAAARAAARCPSQLTPVFPQHLRRAHVPAAELGPLDTVDPIFRSVETLLMSEGL